MVNQIQNREIDGQQIAPLADKPTALWEQGDIVEATLLQSQEDRILLQTKQGVSIEAKIEGAIVGNTGDRILLEVEKVSPTQVVLRPILSEQDIQIRGTIQYNPLRTVLCNANIPITQENMQTAKVMLENGILIEKESFASMQQMKRQLEYAIHHMSEETAKDLLQDQLDIEKITVELLYKYVKNTDTGKCSHKQITEEQKQEKINHFIHQEGKAVLDLGQLTTAIETLLRRGIPITGKNVQTLVGAEKKLQTVQNLDNHTIGHIIRKDMELTLGNVYAAKYSGGKTKPSPEQNQYGAAGLLEKATPMEPEILNQQIQKILVQEGVEGTEANVEAAKLLVDQQLPITAYHIQRVRYIKEELPKLDEKKILEQGADHIRQGKAVTDVLLVTDSYKTGEPHEAILREEAKQLVDTISQIDWKEIDWVQKKQLPMNLKSLRKAVEENEEGVGRSIKDNQKPTQWNQEAVTAKRQLEEIRLRLTAEAAARLRHKNIEIDTVPLQEVVDHLRELEREVYQNQLQKAGTEPTIQKIDEMEELFEGVETLKQVSPKTFEQIMKGSIRFSIEGICQAERLNMLEEPEPVKAQAAMARYEEMGTQPERRFGDSIKKIESQMTVLLQEMQIEPTEENNRAMKILVQNEMPLTEENLMHVKLLDQKVNLVVTKMHPTIAAHMIKEGQQPIKMHIDEVLQYMDRFQEVLGEDVSEKLTQYILEMDEEQALSDIQRQSMMGIYRMLHTIQKEEGKAVGYLMKNGMELTLNNLLEASKYLKRTNGQQADVNVTVDDSFGSLQSLVIDEKNIRAQMGRAFAERDRMEDSEQALDPELEQVNMAPTEKNRELIQTLKDNNLSLNGENLLNISLGEQELRQFLEQSAPEQLAKIIPLEAIEKMPIERVVQILKNVQNENGLAKTDEGYRTSIEKVLGYIDDLQQIRPSTLQMAEHYGVHPSLKNLQILEKMIQDPFFFGKQLQETEKLAGEKIGKEQKLLDSKYGKYGSYIKEEKAAEQILDEIHERIAEVKKEAMTLPIAERQALWKHSGDMEQMIEIQKQIYKQETFYQIPMVLQDRLTHLNLYIAKDKEGRGDLSDRDFRAFISLETETMGVVQIYMQMSDKNVSFKISAEEAEGSVYLQKNTLELEQAISGMGYHIRNIQFHQEDIKNPLAEPVFSNHLQRRRIGTGTFETIG